MSNINEILSSCDPSVLSELKKIMAENDDEKLKGFLKSVSSNIQAKKKVKASVEEKPVEAAIIPNGFDWFRYKGSQCKNIPYADAIICVEPEDVLGISTVVDYLGNSKVIFPAYKHNQISLNADVLNLLKARCKPYTGDVAKLLASAKEVDAAIQAGNRITSQKSNIAVDVKVEPYKDSFKVSLQGSLSKFAQPRFGTMDNMKEVEKELISIVKAGLDDLDKKLEAAYKKLGLED